MRYFQYAIFFFVICCSVFVNCAKRGNITGGPKDTLPPVLLRAYPEMYSTNFSEKVIKLTFDEYVKLDKLNQQLIISPLMEQTPEITPMGFANKQVTIKILDTLKPNTTYSINFGQSIIDNNEGNPYNNFRYVFSTGSFIDSLKVTARIQDAYSKKRNSFTKVMLYDATTFTDSTIFKQKPLYVSNSLDSLDVVTIENVREGIYHLFAIYEKNNNYKFDPNTDKIAFIDKVISTPKDTIYQLNLFKENKKASFGRPSMLSQNKWLIPAEGNLKNINIEVSDFKNTLPNAFIKVENKDSLHVFVANTQADSLKFTLRNGDFLKEYVVKPRNTKNIDSLSIRFLSSTHIDFSDSLRIAGSTPFTHINPSKIILSKKDSSIVPYKIAFDTLANQLKLAFEKEENQEYTIKLLPEAIQDIFGKTNDTLASNIKTKEKTEYANLYITANHRYNLPIKIELLDDKEQILYHQWLSDEKTAHFYLINPNKYFIRVWIDENSNGTWDTGDYLKKRQPEKMFHLPKIIDARANWELRETIDIP